MRKRVMGIDWGEKRIGIALSDESATIAQPFAIFDNDDTFVKKLKELCREMGVEEVVVGLPSRTDRRISDTVSLVRRFADMLKRELGIEVVLWDERFSSVEAARYMSFMKTDQYRKLKDKVEASIILQSYLESVRS